MPAFGARSFDSKAPAGVCEQPDRGGKMDASPGAARSTILRQSDESYENTRPENLSEISENSELSENIERQNEAKWAARLVGAGAELAVRNRSPRLIEQVHHCRQRLEAWRHIPGVKALDERLASYGWGRSSIT